jgi:glycerol-1-phosphate dehydrogenase [NAD(P)+]
VQHAAAFPASAEAWGAVRERLTEPLELFDAVERALTAAGLPAEPGVLGIGTATLRATFRHARRLRARYTVLDFLAGQGMLDDALDAVLPATVQRGATR